jgi:hypothetical protein
MIVKDVAGRRLLCWEPGEQEERQAFELLTARAIDELRGRGLWDGRLRYNTQHGGFVLPEVTIEGIESQGLEPVYDGDAVPVGREHEDGLCLGDDGSPSTTPCYGQAAVTTWATEPGGDGRGFALPQEVTEASP